MEKKFTQRRLTSKLTLRHSTLRLASVVTPAVAAQFSPYRGPIQEGFDFDLHELDEDNVQFIDQNLYENEFHRQISNTIALHGVKAAADGDLDFIDKLLNQVAEFASTTRLVHAHDLIKVCTADGWNMLHAAIVCKRIDILTKLLEYGTEIVHDPVEDETEDTPLILAIKSFTSFLTTPLDLANDSPLNLQVIKLLLEFGADVNVANKKGDTPLIYAVKFQLPEVVRVLTEMEMNANVNARNAIGITALHYAAAFDNEEIAVILLQLNADVFIADRTGKTPVHIACKYGSRKALQMIVDTNHHHVRKIVHDTDSEGNTPLMLAKSAMKFSRHNIELLIACGSNLLAFNHDHNRVLHFYSNCDDKEINEKILDEEPSLLQHMNYDRETALHIAAKFGYKDTCFLYAEKGADIYAQDGSGFTPMMNAVTYGHKEVVKVFFSFGYTVDTVVKQGKMLLEWAIENGHLSLIEAMTDHDPDCVMNGVYNRSNVIHYVCKLGDAPILEYLLKWDESRNIEKTVTTSDSLLGNGYYPLHIAVYNGHIECVNLLCKYSTDIKLRTSERQDTVLHIAARNDQLEILKLLLNQGLDPELSNETEGTALASAAHAGKDHIVAYLLSVGASANGSIERYQLKATPLLLAAKEGHRKVVKLLLENVVDVSITNEEGHNCLVAAILNGHSSTALTILNSKYWRRAMQFRTEKNETPMRLLIQYMPDVAEVALHRCVECTYQIDEHGSSEITEICYSYEFLDDFITPKPTLNAFLSDIFHWNSGNKDKVAKGALSNEITLECNASKSTPTVKSPQHINDENAEEKYMLECGDENNWLQEKFNQKNHPLELMVQHKRTTLLQTPVVAEMWDRKWKTFGLPVFIINISFYMSFLALLTVIALVVPFPQSEICNAPGCWSAWGSWSKCSNLTGCNNAAINVMTRTRTCTQGFGIFDDCEGSNLDSTSCAEISVTSGFIEVNPPVQVAAEGENVTFECTVIRQTAAPFIVEWMSNNETEVLADSISDEQSENVTLPLSFTNVMNEDYQIYTCSGRDYESDDTFVTATAMLTSFECQDQCHFDLNQRKQQSCEERGLEDSDSAFLLSAEVLIIIFSIIQLSAECFQFWRRKVQYVLDFENWLEILVYVVSVVFVARHLDSECFCSDRHTWTMGIIAVFLGWINLLFFLRRVPFTGITISIMYNILTTFLGLIFIAALLIFAFALPFYMLLEIPDRRTPFSSIGRSMLKMLVMTTGEFEFDTIFMYDQELYDEGLSLFLPELTAIMWVIFIIIMPILFSNLLVGLAVGDTQEERAKAQLTKISLQVRLILELENTLSVLRYYAIIPKRLFTREHTWYDFLLGSTKLERREVQLREWEQKRIFQQLKDVLADDPLDEIQDSMNQQKASIKNLQTAVGERLDRMEDQLLAVKQIVEELHENQSCMQASAFTK